MRAIICDGPGDESVMRLGEVPSPELGPDELRIAVAATAVNRADLLQRQGHYPPPPGASEILGLECSGVVMEVGANVHGWGRGDRAMALLPGGGYAEEAVVHAGSAIHLPEGISDEDAAAIPETFLTAYLNIFELARAKSGESILIHGGGSGVGTSAITLCKLAGMQVLVTVGSDDKAKKCLQHGADEAINYNTEDFAERAKGVDIVLDHLGAKYLARDLDALAVGGRVVIIGSMGGERTAQLDVGRLLGRRQQIIGSTLRSRSNDEKGAIVSGFVRHFGAELHSGRLRAVIDSVLPLADAASAHRRMNSSAHFGKIVLRVR